MKRATIALYCFTAGMLAYALNDQLWVFLRLLFEIVGPFLADDLATTGWAHTCVPLQLCVNLVAL